MCLGIDLKVILPPSIELLENDTFTVDIDNDGGYFLNSECQLVLNIGIKKITIDYYSECDRYIVSELPISNSCTFDEFEAKQREIANLLGIETIDVKTPRYLMRSVTVTDIEYDIDGDITGIDLPKELNIDLPCDVENDDIDDYVSDEISNITGYCHKGFSTSMD